MRKFDCKAIVIGVSAGGMLALRKIIPVLSADFPAPVIIVQHMHPYSDNFMIHDLDRKSTLNVRQAEEKENISAGNVYIAPSNYHLLVEQDKTFSLSVCERVNFSRPSIDILFETASEVYQDKLLGIVLTGANKDGSEGAKIIKQRGGKIIVQDPKTAESKVMPQSAIANTNPDHILPLTDIGDFLNKYINKRNK